MSEHSDPLDPVYGQGTRIEEGTEGRSGVRSKTSLAVLAIVVVVALAVIYYFGREKPAAAPAVPAPTEIK